MVDNRFWFAIIKRTRYIQNTQKLLRTSWTFLEDQTHDRGYQKASNHKSNCYVAHRMTVRSRYFCAKESKNKINACGHWKLRCNIHTRFIFLTRSTTDVRADLPAQSCYFSCAEFLGGVTENNCVSVRRKNIFKRKSNNYKQLGSSHTREDMARIAKDCGIVSDSPPDCIGYSACNPRIVRIHDNSIVLPNNQRRYGRTLPRS